MPVLKIPIIHKFGIISHCQRLQLQSRLFNEPSGTKADRTSNICKKNLVEITEEFVTKYNSIVESAEASETSKVQMKDAVNKIFMKNKRRIGLQFNCQNQPHINVALSWTELTIISQCNGEVSLKSLDLIITSLSAAPINQSTFIVQFYLLETALYFLQTTEFLSSHPEKHIKWLQIGELASVRIYAQCRLQMVQCPRDNLDNLRLYMKDIDKYQVHFNMFPEAAISFSVIFELTEYLTKTFDVNLTKTDTRASEHDISAFLWHCTDLWRCCFYSSHRSEMNDAISSIEECLARNTGFGSWLDCYLALGIMASSSTIDNGGLVTFESIIVGLAEANADMEQRPSSRVSQPIEGEINPSQRICGYEKGTLLLFAAIREFLSLPILCHQSAEREQSLSTIAQWLLHISSCHFPNAARKIIVSRLQSILSVIELMEHDCSLSVMKNAVWSLLEAVQRKKVIEDNIDHCLIYGNIVASCMLPVQLPPCPQMINDRIAVVSSTHLFPVMPSNISEVKLVRNPRITDGKTHKKPIRSSMEPVARKRPNRIENRKSGYSQQLDRQLQTMTEHLWVTDLQDLERAIDEADKQNGETIAKTSTRDVENDN